MFGDAHFRVRLGRPVDDRDQLVTRPRSDLLGLGWELHLLRAEEHRLTPADKETKIGIRGNKVSLDLTGATIQEIVLEGVLWDLPDLTTQTLDGARETSPPSPAAR
jgi:hypothetical protein